MYRKLWTKNIKTFIKEKTGKSIQTKDINNIKLQAVKEKDGGLSKGDILGNMLKELTVKRQAATLVEVDDSKNVDLVYIQTGEMREQYNKYPEILFVDTTYNVNIEAYPLLTMMVEDGDGRGKPVAYCFQRSETKVNLEKILDYFCRTNDTSKTKIVMVDKDLTEISVLKSKLPSATITPRERKWPDNCKCTTSNGTCDVVHWTVGHLRYWFFIYTINFFF